MKDRLLWQMGHVTLAEDIPAKIWRSASHFTIPVVLITESVMFIPASGTAGLNSGEDG